MIIPISIIIEDTRLRYLARLIFFGYIVVSLGRLGTMGMR